MSAAVPDTTAAALPGTRALRRPIALLCLGYALLWLLGLSTIAWLGAGVLAGVGLLRRGGRPIVFPPMFLLWVAFLGWLLLSAVTLSEVGRVAAYGYRLSAWVCATLLFLWIYNAPREGLPERVIVRLLAWFWIAVAIGGLVAVTVPELEYATVAERLSPQGLLDIDFYRELVHVNMAQVSRIVLSQDTPRPAAPFPFTNAWGLHYALLLPMLLASWRWGTRLWRTSTGVLLAASLVPVILSLNRGLWIALAAEMVFVLVTMTRRGRVLAPATLLIGVAVVAGTMVIAGLGDVVTARVDAGHSDAGRASLYSQAIDLAIESPILGHGAPQPNLDNPDGPSAGTHGQFWLVLVSTGVPGTVFYVAFMLAILLALRRRPDQTMWYGAMFVTTIVLLPLYEQMPTGVIVQMIAAATALRALRAPDLASGSPPHDRVGTPAPRPRANVVPR